MNLRFDDQVAIVTGSSSGLGRGYALELARRGARVVINGASASAQHATPSGAEDTAAVIHASGGQALIHYADVADATAVERMVAHTLATWGRVDVLINNAGFLCDRAFAKATLSDFQSIVGVHLMGSANCTRAVWPTMCRQGYGRILFTTSAAGLYGNFGQASYGAAKMALLGLMNTLAIEGRKHGVRVNCLSPAASTRLVGPQLPAPIRAALAPERVAPAAIFLVGKAAPSGVVMGAGGGGFSRIRIMETTARRVSDGEPTAEDIAAQWDLITSSPLNSYDSASQQIASFLDAASIKP